MKRRAVNLRVFLKDETAATMAEYVLMVTLVAAVCVVAVTAIGVALSASFMTMAGKF